MKKIKKIKMLLLLYLTFLLFELTKTEYPNYPATNMFDTVCPKYSCSEDIIAEGCAIRRGS